MRLVLRPFALTLALGNSNPYLALENFVWHHPLEMFRCGAGVFVPRLQDHRRKGLLKFGGPRPTRGEGCLEQEVQTDTPGHCRLLEPGLESHEIEPPGTGFVDFWSQGWKVMRSSLLGLVLSTSGAKAGKS